MHGQRHGERTDMQIYKMQNWKNILLNSRAYINRKTLNSFRVLILSHLNEIYSHLSPIEQDLLIDDLFHPLDVKDLISILKLLLKFKKIYFLNVILEFYSLDWIVKSKENVEKDWENWISLIFHVQIAFKLNSNTFFGDLFTLVIRILKDVKDLTDFGIELDKIIAKATRTNNLREFFILLDEEEDLDISNLIMKLSFYEQEMFLYQYLIYLEEKNDLESSSKKFFKIAGIRDSRDHSLKMTIKSRFFSNRIQEYGKMHLLVHSIAVNQVYLLTCAKYLIRNWANSNLISSNAIQSCKHYYCFLLLIINHIN